MRASHLAVLALLALPPSLPAQPPAAAPDPAPAAAAADLAETIRAHALADSFSGAVMVARGGVPLVRVAYGLADRETATPVSPETKFNLGSIDKLLTRIAIWQLVAAGKLDLDAPVGRYIPDYPNADVRERVTVRHLYTMTSGVGNFMNAEYLRRHEEIRTVDDYLSLFARDPLHFAPGTGRLYSNGGYIILGKLIERLSGRTYHDFVLAGITGPLGMSSTRHYLIDERVPGRATGYTTSRGTPAPNAYSLAGRGGPAGGGYSTVDDFLALDGALRAGTLLPGTFADSILPDGFRGGSGEPLIYGGGGPGTNTQYVAFPDGHTIIVFANSDPPKATAMMQVIARSLGRSVPGPTGRIIRPPGG